MMNTQIWNNVVPDGMKELPIPLSGHCSVMINSNKVLIIGGETTDGVNEEWLDRYSAHHVTDHVHIYKFSTDKWYSTAGDANMNGKVLNKLIFPRQNHDCIKYSEGGKQKILAVGGVSAIEDTNHKIEDTAEILDLDTLKWKLARPIPRKVTGSKLILVDGRPTIIGAYGDANQDIIITYTQDDNWIDLPVRLLKGRSDFMVILSFIFQY